MYLQQFQDRVDVSKEREPDRGDDEKHVPIVNVNVGKELDDDSKHGNRKYRREEDRQVVQNQKQVSPLVFFRKHVQGMHPRLLQDVFTLCD